MNAVYWRCEVKEFGRHEALKRANKLSKNAKRALKNVIQPNPSGSELTVAALVEQCNATVARQLRLSD
jgi:hypothetical protein